MEVVTLLVGRRFGPEYVVKLQSMLERHMPVPFRLNCLVDRNRKLPDSIRRLDIAERQLKRPGMRLTTNKILLFDREALPFHEFLYLDVSLVITKSLAPLLDFAASRPEDLAVVKDWNYDCYNTCVMRLRHSETMQRVFDNFASGKRYPYRNRGDQDFIHSTIEDFELQSHVAIFPEWMVAPYRDARFLHRSDPKAAYKWLNDALIVKFYGRHKMHLVANPLFRIARLRMKLHRHAKADSQFWVKELLENWR